MPWVVRPKRVVGIDGDRLRHVFIRALDAVLPVRRPAVLVVELMDEGEPGVGVSVVRIERQCAFQMRQRLGEHLDVLVRLRHELPGLEELVVRSEIGRAAAGDQLVFLRRQRHLQRRDDLPRHLVLHREDVGEVAVVAFRPKMRRRVDASMSCAVMRTRFPARRMLPSSTDLDAEIAPDRADVDVLALVGEARVARDHQQAADLRQIGDDVLADAVGEIFLLGVARHVGERQHGDRLHGLRRLDCRAAPPPSWSRSRQRGAAAAAGAISRRGSAARCS